MNARMRCFPLIEAVWYVCVLRARCAIGNCLSSAFARMRLCGACLYPSAWAPHVQTMVGFGLRAMIRALAVVVVVVVCRRAEQLNADSLCRRKRVISTDAVDDADDDDDLPKNLSVI